MPGKTRDTFAFAFAVANGFTSWIAIGVPGAIKFAGGDKVGNGPKLAGTLAYTALVTAHGASACRALGGVPGGGDIGRVWPLPTAPGGIMGGVPPPVNEGAGLLALCGG
jgi:hypothetical protein